MKITTVERGPDNLMVPFPTLVLEAGDHLIIRDTPDRLKEFEKILEGTLYADNTIAVQHKALVSRIRGHFGYFGVNENHKGLKSRVYWSKRAWYKWLNRRSQRASLNWKQFLDLSKDYPFTITKVYVNIWESP